MKAHDHAFFRRGLLALLAAGAFSSLSVPLVSVVAADSDTPARIDYLTFAQGAVALGRGVDLEAAVAAIDGNRAKYSLAKKPVTDATVTELTYELPALTTFDRFAVPEVAETASPSQTFVRNVEVLGSSTSARDGFTPIAKGTLRAEARSGHDTELEVLARTPVRWITLRLQGGIDQGREPFFQEFTEIIGNGTQETVPLADTFHGIWKQGANVLELQQDGAVVEGCYDVNGELHGTVTGNVLRATGVSRDTSVRSAFVLTVDRDGGIHGVRSANGAPFRDYALPIAPKGTRTPCSEKKPGALGCGSIVHGIGFDFDSAAIRPESEAVLASLFAGLQSATVATIAVEGHTSSEGSESYNQDLSARRASAVVNDLVRRGIAAERIRAVGRGESKPIADNRDEAGRALNRRVEIVCNTAAG